MGWFGRKSAVPAGRRICPPAAVGKELLQFGRAVALGGGAYRLSKLLRGRNGTE